MEWVHAPSPGIPIARFDEGRCKLSSPKAPGATLIFFLGATPFLESGVYTLVLLDVFFYNWALFIARFLDEPIEVCGSVKEDHEANV